MAVITVRNLPDDIHRALRLRAAQHGRSTEAEVRMILESAVKPPGRPKLGTLMVEHSQRAGVTQDDVAAFERALQDQRTTQSYEPLKFE
jgi:plasmid stability protein